jgi:chitodextrinase
MRSATSLSRRGLLLIAISSPALFGSYFKCVAVSNPTVTTARIEVVEPITLRVGDVMRVTGSGDGAPPLQFAWDFGDGSQAGGMQATHAYMAPGSYRVTLVVRDAVGSTASDFSQVSVSGRPSSSLLNVALLSPAVAGQPVIFEASPLQSDAGALTYVWTFSDGQSAFGARPAAIFPAAGTYVASVSVETDLGAVAGAQMVFHVMDGAR